MCSAAGATCTASSASSSRSFPAQQQLGEIWYRGTADAVYQNLDIIEQHRPETVLVLAGDHVYKMDYGPMIAFHEEKGADITIGVRRRCRCLRRASSAS